MWSVFLFVVSKILYLHKRGLEEGEFSEESAEHRPKNRRRSDRRRSAEAKGFGEGFAQGFEEGKKVAEAKAFEEGSQASKAEVAALKRQLQALLDQLEREVLRADNLQYRLDFFDPCEQQRIRNSTLESETPRQEDGSGEI